MQNARFWTWIDYRLNNQYSSSNTYLRQFLFFVKGLLEEGTIFDCRGHNRRIRNDQLCSHSEFLLQLEKSKNMDRVYDSNRTISAT